MIDTKDLMRIAGEIDRCPLTCDYLTDGEVPADDVIRQAAAELDSLRAEREWRPIAEAPKDGTPVMVWRGGHIIDAWWADFYGEECWRGHGWAFPNYDTATHWQPLPEPPEIK